MDPDKRKRIKKYRQARRRVLRRQARRLNRKIDWPTLIKSILVVLTYVVPALTIFRFVGPIITSKWFKPVSLFFLIMGLIFQIFQSFQNFQRNSDAMIALKGQVTSLQVENNHLKAEKTELTKKNTTFKEKYDSLKIDQDKLILENSGLKLDNHKSELQLQTSEKENTTLTVSNEQLETKMKQVKEERKRLDRELKKAQSALMKQIDKNVSSINTLAEKAAENRQLKKDLEIALKKTGQSAEKTQLQVDIGRLTAENQGLKALLQSTEKVLEEKKNDLAKAQEILGKTQTELRDTRDDFSKLQEEVIQLRTQLRVEIRTIREELKQSNRSRTVEVFFGIIDRILFRSNKILQRKY